MMTSDQNDQDRRREAWEKLDADYFDDTGIATAHAQAFNEGLQVATTYADEFGKMVESRTKAWADVPSATQFVEELRGNETDKLTIESCIALAGEKGAFIDKFVSDNRDDFTVEFHPDNFLAYSQTLEAKVTAPLRAIIEKRDQEMLVDIERETKLREELAGCQEMLRQKDEAMKEIQRKLQITSYFIGKDFYFDAVEQALALSSPTAALETVRAEDKAEIERLKQHAGYLQTELARYENMEPAAHMFPEDLAKFQEQETFATAYSVKVGSPDGTTVELFTHPKE